MGMFDNLTSFDAFSRTDSEYRIRTKSGAISTAALFGRSGRPFTQRGAPHRLPPRMLQDSSFLTFFSSLSLYSFIDLISSYLRTRFEPLSPARSFHCRSFPFSACFLLFVYFCVVSIAALSIMALLFITELSIFLSSDIKPELYVDTSLGEHIQINLDIAFHALPCPRA